MKSKMTFLLLISSLVIMLIANVGSAATIDIDIRNDTLIVDHDTLVFRFNPAGPFSYNEDDIFVLHNLTDTPAEPVSIAFRNGSGAVFHSANIPAGDIDSCNVNGNRNLKWLEAENSEEKITAFITLQIPTLTQWGIIALVVLLLASAVFIMLRRRKAAVPA